jgi:hypothetical protein
MCHDKHCKLYIVMDETTRFTSHVSWAMTFVLEKPHCFVMCILNMKVRKEKKYFYVFAYPQDLS